MRKPFLLMIALLMLPLLYFPLAAEAVTVDDNTVPVNVYSGRKSYSCHSDSSLGRSLLGEMSLNAAVEDRYVINRTYGYGVKAGEEVSFRYDRLADTSIHVCDDSYYRSVTWSNGSIEALGASVRHGAILVLKRVNGESAFTRVATAVDVFGEDATDTDAFYTCSPADIQKGCTYTVLVLYATYEGDYCRYLEEYSFYISLSDSLVLIQPLELAGMSYDADNELSYQLMQNGCTLQDGSVVSSGFTLVNKGDTHNQIYVSYNGDAYQRTIGGDCYRRQGVYRIKTVSVNGETEIRTVYITPPLDMAPAFYFVDPVSPISSDTRVFSEEDCPVYRNEIVLRCCDVAPLPVLQGVLTKLPDAAGEAAEARHIRVDEAGMIRVTEEGRWLLELYNGDPSRSGTFFKATFYFMITHNYTANSINKYLLDHQKRIMNYEMLHYEVLLPTAGGGNLHICFANDHYLRALDCAYNLEMRHVTDPSEYEYRGVTYASYPEMMQAINQAAKSAVSLRVYDPGTVYNSPTEGISDIGTYSTADDEYLLIDNEYARSMTRIISPDFAFIRVPYQCERITATCRHCNATVDVFFGVPVKELLHHGSWEIRELDAQGNMTGSYEIDVMLENTVEYQLTTESSTKRYWGTHALSVSQVCRIDDIRNFYDTEGVAIVVDHTRSQTHIFAVAQLQEITVFNGHYTVILKDRVGNRVEIEVHIPKENERPGSSFVIHDGVRNDLEKVYASETERTGIQHPDTPPGASEERPADVPRSGVRGCTALVSSVYTSLWAFAAGLLIHVRKRKEDNR